uniref:Uncharacterized protein n=1 Tax=Glossina pallidipes TaxID=7398 RepID=A0A1A9ZJU5_GLOPL
MRIANGLRNRLEELWKICQIIALMLLFIPALHYRLAESFIGIALKVFVNMVTGDDFKNVTLKNVPSVLYSRKTPQLTGTKTVTEDGIKVNSYHATIVPTIDKINGSTTFIQQLIIKKYLRQPLLYRTKMKSLGYVGKWKSKQ